MEQEHKFQVDKLTLETGQNLMIPGTLLSMHQPTLFTLGLLGQTNFLTAATLLAYPSRVIKIKKEMEHFFSNDFVILMQMFRSQDDTSKINMSLAMALLSLLFPLYEIKFVGNMFLFNHKENGSQIIVNEENYPYIQQGIIQIFHLEEIVGESTQDTKEDTPMVKRIKEKLRKRHEILAKKKKSGGQMDVLSRYMSIVSVGLQISLNEIKQYTVYQLFDNFKRLQLKDEFDLYIKRATSFGGVKKGEKVKNWQKDLDEPPDS